MAFGRRTAEEKAALRAEKDKRKAESRERLRSVIDERRGAENERRGAENEKRTQVLTGMLQPDESVLALLTTAEAVMKKLVLFTPKRVLVAPVHDPASAESIPYRSITGFAASNFITKDIKLNVSGRRGQLELSFSSADDRDKALAILSANAV
ncbi:MAG TPA: hypothetical protein VNI55_01880 [Gaiellaceae bacterium]|nr:hypothetical protein [Gaiellaceae bacterium]